MAECTLGLLPRSRLFWTQQRGPHGRQSGAATAARTTTTAPTRASSRTAALDVQQGSRQQLPCAGQGVAAAHRPGINLGGPTAVPGRCSRQGRAPASHAPGSCLQTPRAHTAHRAWCVACQRGGCEAASRSLLPGRALGACGAAAGRRRALGTVPKLGAGGNHPVGGRRAGPAAQRQLPGGPAGGFLPITPQMCIDGPTAAIARRQRVGPTPSPHPPPPPHARLQDRALHVSASLSGAGFANIFTACSRFQQPPAATWLASFTAAARSALQQAEQGAGASAFEPHHLTAMLTALMDMRALEAGLLGDVLEASRWGTYMRGVAVLVGASTSGGWSGLHTPWKEVAVAGSAALQ